MNDQLEMIETEVAIVGAGPAGNSAALFLAKEGVPHLLFDKTMFPRDKVCGDGLSGKVVHLLQEIDPRLVEKMAHAPDKFLGSWGVRFVAPSGKDLLVPYNDPDGAPDYAPGFVARRYDFDHFLVEQLDARWTDRRFGYALQDVSRENGVVRLVFSKDGRQVVCRARLVIAADGERSLIARKVNGYRMEPEHYYAGIRAYYKNVTGMSEGNFIELHFIKEALPGYFWIFPLPGNRANVGIDMLSDDIRKKKINLRQIFESIIATHPEIKQRFRHAQRESRISGWGLPIGSKRRRISGDGYLLTGDAAGLIDPFTGEGIGNAMISGKFAARVAAQAVAARDYSAARLAQYDDLVYARLQKELELSNKIRNLARFPWLFNFLFNRLNGNAEMRQMFSAMFNDLDVRAKLRSPSFYLRLLFG